MVQAIACSGLASHGDAYNESVMNRTVCQACNWDINSNEPKRYQRQIGFELVNNHKVRSGTLAITSPSVQARVAAADAVRAALQAAGHNYPDLGPKCYGPNTLALYLNPDKLVRDRVACVDQKWANAAEDVRPLAEQLASAPTPSSPPGVGQRMTLRAASKAVGGSACPAFYRQLPLYPSIPCAMTMRLVKVLVDNGMLCQQYGIGLWSAGIYFAGRISAMPPAAKSRFGISLATLQGTEAADVQAAAVLMASGGPDAVLQRMRALNGATGIWGWAAPYLPGPSEGIPIIAPGIAETFMQTNDWAMRSRRREGAWCVHAIADTVVQLGGGNLVVKVAYSHLCDDGGAQGGPMRQALLMELANVIRPIGERAVRHLSRGWNTSEHEAWRSAKWTVRAHRSSLSLWAACSLHACSSLMMSPWSPRSFRRPGRCANLFPRANSLPEGARRMPLLHCTRTKTGSSIAAHAGSLGPLLARLT